jgi:hypothetical protein
MGELQRCGEVLVLIDTKEGCVIRILFSYDEIAFAILKNAFTIAPIHQQLFPILLQEFKIFLQLLSL